MAFIRMKRFHLQSKRHVWTSRIDRPPPDQTGSTGCHAGRLGIVYQTQRPW